MLAQVVKQDSPSIIMKSWNHVIWGIPTDALIDKFRSIPHLYLDTIESQTEAFEKLQECKLFMYLQISDKSVSTLKMTFSMMNSVRLCMRYQSSFYFVDTVVLSESRSTLIINAPS